MIGRYTLQITLCTVLAFLVGPLPSAEFDPVAPRSLHDVPWYDAAHGALRAPHVRTRAEPVHPGSWSVDLNRPDGAISWPEVWLHWVQAIGIGLLMLAIGLVITALLRYWKADRTSKQRTPVDGDAATASLQSLPIPLSQSQHDLLGAARDYYQRGELGMAVVYYYSYQLMELDRAGVVRLARGKTTRQYIAEARALPPVQDVLRHTSRLFEAFFFGRHIPPLAAFEACWSQLEVFQRHIGSSRSGRLSP